MTEDERPGQPSNQDAAGQPTSGLAWRERAAFHVSVDYATDSGGRLIWQTRAYHEESDTRSSWPGVPGEALLHWLTSIAELPGAARGPAEAAAPPEQAPADDFKQIIGISAASEQRLHSAGIRSYAQLAAKSAAELGALLDIPAERIARRGWITRARALEKLASITARASKPGPPSEPEPAGLSLYAEIHVDAQGEVIDRRLSRDDAPTPPGPIEGYVARFFIEQTAWPTAPVDAGGLDWPAGELELEVEELQLDALPAPGGAGISRLRAHAPLRLAGLAAAQLQREPLAYVAYVLAYELETGETKVLQSVGGQISPALPATPVVAEFDTPEIGRYQMIIAVLVADYNLLGAATGPRLRVSP